MLKRNQFIVMDSGVFARVGQKFEGPFPSVEEARIWRDKYLRKNPSRWTRIKAKALFHSIFGWFFAKALFDKLKRIAHQAITLYAILTTLVLIPSSPLVLSTILLFPVLSALVGHFVVTLKSSKN